MTTKTNMPPPKKQYSKPSLTTYGDIRDLTRTSSLARNRDLQQFGSNSRT